MDTPTDIHGRSIHIETDESKQERMDALATRYHVRTGSGMRIYLADPDPELIEFKDIAKGLSRIARWNGQTTGVHPYSVAQHSVMVSRIAGTMLTIDSTYHDETDHPHIEMLALMHDAAEYLIGDIVRPVRSKLFNDLDDLERNIMVAICMTFDMWDWEDLNSPTKEILVEADRIALRLEAEHLMNYPEDVADLEFGRLDIIYGDEEKDFKLNEYLRGDHINLRHLLPVAPNIAERRFTVRFKDLKDDMPAT